MSANGASGDALDGVSEHPWFVSYAGADRVWAEWVGWQLQEAGFQVELDCWSWGAGDNFILKMDAALERGRFLALFSPAYFEPERFTTPEWTAVLAMKERITPVRVADVVLPAILRSVIAPALFGLDDVAAREELLRAVIGPSRPGTAPPPPPGMSSRNGQDGGDEPRFPGTLPRIWDLPSRNAAFTGRDSTLVHLREALASGRRVAVQALYGRGGVGKTQLAIEYAYRFAGAYESAGWIPSEDPALIPDQLAQFAVEIGAAPEGTPAPVAVRKLLAELRTRPHWLIVFDNAEDPTTLAPFLPGGPGHVLITSRNPNWNSHAVPLDIDTLSRTESIALLRAQGAQLSDADADHIAAALDDLPLALAQAAALLTGGLSAADLKEELAANTAAVLAAGPPPAHYPVSLAAQVQLTAAHLHQDHPGAHTLLLALALLAPEPFPLTSCARHLPDQASTLLADVLASKLTVGTALQSIARHGLARVQDGTVQLHRLTQAVLTHHLTPDQHDTVAAGTEALLTAAHPGRAGEPQFWPAWQALLPHALAADPAQLTTEKGRGVVREACWYLMDRGQPAPARERLQVLYDTWRRQLGPDHDDTLAAAHSLARAFDDTLDRERARALDEDTLARRWRLYGEEHPDTLVSARHLAVRLWALGRYQEAVTLDEKTLEVQRRVRGAEHPHTLTTATGLAVELAAVGRVEEALVLEEETLGVQRRVLGAEHPDTLLTASNLAVRLAQVGRVGDALVLGEETLEVQRRVVGVEHPRTLATASNLVNRLADVGRVGEALVLAEETLGVQRRVVGPEHPDTLSAASNLAVRLGEVGRVEEALVLGEETLEVRRRVLGPDHPDTLTLIRNLKWLRARYEHE
ncbi:FxSxx-COOH system tetratricopeptide repeat protein [Streptomyces sp. NPDC090106]|uniref:FxSxx-COOH system tetratricopeptide repeat protein n=1 Tax=Streptomyces sp. NPDC090106 TaxID=3365946 RepID=UPI00382B69D7